MRDTCSPAPLKTPPSDVAGLGQRPSESARRPAFGGEVSPASGQLCGNLISRRSALGLLLGSLIGGVVGFGAPPAQARAPAFRLILVEQKGCAGCAAWLREIGPQYAARVPEAPLTRVDVHEGNWPEGIVIGARPNVTPTFLVLRDGVEIARLYGYAGENRFWPSLRAALQTP